MSKTLCLATLNAPCIGTTEACGKCIFCTTVGTFEESGKSWFEHYTEMDEQYKFLDGAYREMTALANEWREKYEELLDAVTLQDSKMTLVSLPVVTPDELVVKPHKRHRPRRKDTLSKPILEAGFWRCGICLGIWSPTIGKCPNGCNQTLSSTPTPTEPLAQPGGDSEGVDPRIADVFRRLDNG